MKTKILILLPLILLAGCSKINHLVMTKKTQTPYYIDKYVSSDTTNAYKGEYYIHVKYKGLATTPFNCDSCEIRFTQTKHEMQQWYYPTDVGDSISLSREGTRFINLKTKQMLGVFFYMDRTYSSKFQITYADYCFSNVDWSSAGANIVYAKKSFDNQSFDDEFKEYFGTDSPESYFVVTYIGDNRINGYFKTRWITGTSLSYSVQGDFSIPPVQSVFEKKFLKKRDTLPS